MSKKPKYPTFILSRRHPQKVTQAIAERVYDKLKQHPEGLTINGLAGCGVYQGYLMYFMAKNFMIFKSTPILIGRKKQLLWKIREDAFPVYLSEQEYIKVVNLAAEYVSATSEVDITGKIELPNFIKWLKDKIHGT